MGRTSLSENYSICLKDDGSPREISRHGAVVTYKAIGYESGRAVALQLIPLTSIEQKAREQFEEQARTVQKLDHVNIAKIYDVGVEGDHLVFATEFLQGETAESWIVNHGPMPADAVVRIAMQTVGALAAAAYHSLTHRSLQPANLMIVPGAAPDGGWPLVKLMNFGLAGLKLYSEGSEPTELAPSISPQFASPEQLAHGTVDFRSEMFSLGATLCFLLTGAVPLAGATTGSAAAERVLPTGANIPRSLRNILRRMLRNNPDERPQDPVVLTDELRRCLQKIERRTAFTRKFGESSPIVPIELPDRPSRSRWLAAAAIVVLLALLAALLLPERLRAFVHRNRSIDSIGVPVGVPENAPQKNTSVAANNATPAPAASAPITQQNAIAQNNQPPVAPAPSGPVTQKNAIAQNKAQLVIPENSPPPPSAAPSTPGESAAPIIASNRMAEPPPPAEGPPPQTPSSPAAVNETPQVASAPVESNDAAVRKALPVPEQSPAQTNERKTATSRAIAKQNSRRARAAQNRAEHLPPMRVGSMRAEFVGTTQDGNWILQLPSGNTVVTPPVPDVNDVPVIHRRARKVRIEPRDIPPEDQAPVVVLPPGND